MAVNGEVEDGLTGEPVTAALIVASFRSSQAAEALQRFWEERYAVRRGGGAGRGAGRGS